LRHEVLLQMPVIDPNNRSIHYKKRLRMTWKNLHVCRLAFRIVLILAKT